MAILIRRGLLSLFDKRKLRPGELAITTDGTKLYYCYSAGNVKEVATVDDLQNILDAQPEAYHALQELISELNDNTSLAASMLAQINQNKSDIEAIQSDLSGYWELNPGTQLTTGQDLNDLMTPGVYYSPSSSITSTLLNTPDGVSPGFRLVVETSTGASHVHQIIIPHQSNSTFFLRIYSTDTAGWRPWQKLLNQSDIVNVLTSTATDKPLSAAQGKVLQDGINAINDNLAQGSTWVAIQNKKGDAWHRLQLNSNGAVKIYTSNNQGSSWDEINEVITESKVNSTDASLSNMTNGITVYGGIRIRKNAFMVSGTITVKIVGTFSKNAWHTVCKISPPPLQTINTVGEVDDGNTVVLQHPKVQFLTTGEVNICCPEELSGTKWMSCNVSYFYA